MFLLEMDFISAFLCFIASLPLVAFSLESGSTTSGDCRQCKPGYYAARLCSDTYDTVCSPCAKGTFTANENILQKCSICSKCEVGEFISLPCLPHSNTICESCSAVQDVISDSFLRDCVQSDSSFYDKGLNEQKVNVKYIKDTRTLPVEKNDVYEGSGIPIEEDKKTKYDTYDVLHETIEGSGEAHYETTTATNQTTRTPIPIIPETEDKIEDIIINVTETNTSHATSTTPAQISNTTTRLGVITIGDGITLKNETEEQTELNVLVPKTPKKSTSVFEETTLTTIKAIIIDHHDGIVIPSESTTRIKGLRSGKGEGIIVNEEETVKEYVSQDEPQFEASKTEDTDQETGGVSVGVFIAVCIVCAAVFFVIGLMVNKYWGNRRARSFNVEQAEKQNGNTFHGGKIEFKDPENNVTTKTGIYDEIPVDKQNGKEAVGKDAVYSKPVKRTADNPVKNSNPAAAGAGGSDKAPSSERPVNEARYSRHSASIKYIDDEQTDEERETDKLLSPAKHEEEITTSENNITENLNEEKQEPPVTEITPMISKDNDTINV